MQSCSKPNREATRQAGTGSYREAAMKQVAEWWQRVETMAWLGGCDLPASVSGFAGLAITRATSWRRSGWNRPMAPEQSVRTWERGGRGRRRLWMQGTG